MKLGIMEKITIAVTIILIVWAGICIYRQIKTDNNINSYLITIPEAEKKDLPANIEKLSKKYKAYEDLYNSDKPIFTYGYMHYTLKKNEGMKFHKELTKKLEEEKLDYKIISYKNWKDYDNEVEEDNYAVYEGDETKCLMSDPSAQELDLLRQTATECLSNTCIIDKRRKKYIVISKDIDFIIDELKKYNKK